MARLSATFEASGEGDGPSTAELSRALEELTRDLEAALGPGATGTAGGRVDRALEELVETYRPRQRELVDLLLADGEITAGEHAALLLSLGTRPAPAPPPVPVPSASPAAADLTTIGETPIAAVPLSAEPRLPPARPVPELLRTFQITSLRQAGAVRARRQISFAEYMALKRHFEAEASPDGARASAADRSA